MQQVPSSHGVQRVPAARAETPHDRLSGPGQSDGPRLSLPALSNAHPAPARLCTGLLFISRLPVVISILLI